MHVNVTDRQTAATPRGRLFLMMLLQIFIWGAWLPLIFGYLPTLGYTPVQQSWIARRVGWIQIVRWVDDTSVEITGPNTIDKRASKPWILGIVHPLHDWQSRICVGTNRNGATAEEAQ